MSEISQSVQLSYSERHVKGRNGGGMGSDAQDIGADLNSRREGRQTAK